MDISHRGGKPGFVRLPHDAQGGAQRLVVVRVGEALRRRGALPWRWSAPEPARQLDDTGSWPSPAA